jgi:acetyl esterase/lipase
MDHITGSNHLKITYKLVDNVALHIDVYPPSPPPVEHDKTTEGIPVVVYFHGGGMTAGDRKSWFPTWLYRKKKFAGHVFFLTPCLPGRLSSAGIAFISADYRLVLPSTGHDTLQDIKDLFTFLVNGLNPALDEELSALRLPSFHINPKAIAVSGTSAGGLCAYLSVMHATYKPVALLSMYGMGGNFLVSVCELPALYTSYMTTTISPVTDRSLSTTED